jgi:hypothetical protein
MHIHWLVENNFCAHSVGICYGTVSPKNATRLLFPRKQFFWTKSRLIAAFGEGVVVRADCSLSRLISRGICFDQGHP